MRKKRSLEVRQPQRDRRGHERQSETVHRAIQRAVELEAEGVPAVHEPALRTRRASPVKLADEDAHGPLSKTTTSNTVRAIVISDVHEGRGHVGGGALLDAEEATSSCS